MAGTPVSGSYNTDYPSGYSEIKAILDTDAVRLDKQAKCSYYSTKLPGMGAEHDIFQYDIVFTTRTPSQHSMGETGSGLTAVRSSLTGLSKIPVCGQSLMELARLSEASGDPDVDVYIQDLISAHIQLLGVAYGDAKFSMTNRTATGAFAVAIAGVMTLQVHEYVPVGALLQAVPPLPSEFRSGNMKPRDGDGSKIPLKLIPVSPDDLGNYFTRMMHRYIFGTLPRDVDPLIHLTTDGRTMAMYHSAKSTADFAKMAGILFLNTLLKYDVVAPSISPFAAADEEADHEFEKETYTTFGYGYLEQARKQRANIPPEHRRKALGHVLSFSTEGGNITYPMPNGTLIANTQNATSPLLPEEITAVVAQGIRLFGDTVSPVGANVVPRLPHRGEYMAHALGSHPGFKQERETFKQLERDFLSALFLAEKPNKEAVGSKRCFEFGFLDYEAVGDANAHLGRKVSSRANFIDSVDRRSISGRILGKQLSAPFTALRGFQNLYNMTRSKILGRSLQATNKGGRCKMILNSAV